MSVQKSVRSSNMFINDQDGRGKFLHQSNFPTNTERILDQASGAMMTLNSNVMKKSRKEPLSNDQPANSLELSIEKYKNDMVPISNLL